MFYFYLILSSIALLVVVILVRYLLYRRTNIAVDLFMEAVKLENTGNFLAAGMIYARALREVKKMRFQDELKTKIIEKIRIMHDTASYNTFLQYTKI